jgi:hypothetical protein
MRKAEAKNKNLGLYKKRTDYTAFKSTQHLKKICYYIFKLINFEYYIVTYFHQCSVAWQQLNVYEIDQLKFIYVKKGKFIPGQI